MPRYMALADIYMLSTGICFHHFRRLVLIQNTLEEMLTEKKDRPGQLHPLFHNMRHNKIFTASTLLSILRNLKTISHSPTYLQCHHSQLVYYRVFLYDIPVHTSRGILGPHHPKSEMHEHSQLLYW